MWETQVLILTSLNNKNIYFVGPYSLQVNLEAITKLFPMHDEENPIIHKESIRSDFFKTKSGNFRASPPNYRNTYFTWLKCLEAKMIQHCKNIGIYGLIQLSKYDVVSLDMPVLMAFFCFGIEVYML